MPYLFFFFFANQLLLEITIPTLTLITCCIEADRISILKPIFKRHRKLLFSRRLKQYAQTKIKQLRIINNRMKFASDGEG